MKFLKIIVILNICMLHMLCAMVERQGSARQRIASFGALGGIVGGCYGTTLETIAAPFGIDTNAALISVYVGAAIGQGIAHTLNSVSGNRCKALNYTAKGQLKGSIVGAGIGTVVGGPEGAAVGYTVGTIIGVGSGIHDLGLECLKEDLASALASGNLQYIQNNLLFRLLNLNRKINYTEVGSYYPTEIVARYSPLDKVVALLTWLKSRNAAPAQLECDLHPESGSVTFMRLIDARSYLIGRPEARDDIRRYLGLDEES